MGHRVLVIDMDVGLNNLDVLLGVENRIMYDIVDVASGSHLFERIDFINEYGLTKEEYNYVIMGK